MSLEKRNTGTAPSHFLRFLRQKEGVLGNGTENPEVPTKISPLILEKSEESMEELITRTRDRHQTLLGQLDQGENRQRILDKIASQYDGAFQKFLISPNYHPEWLKENTRKVFYDVETQFFPNDLWDVRDPNNPKPDQKVAACVSIDDQGDVRCWDDQTARQLIPYLLSYDEVVAFNGYSHDNMVLSAYASDPNEVQSLYNKSFDLMRHMAFRETQWDQEPNYNRRDLNYYADRYVAESKLKNHAINGSKNIIELIRNGSDEERAWVWKYCFQDVLLLVKLYRQYKISMRKKAFFYRQQILDIEKMAKGCLK